MAPSIEDTMFFPRLRRHAKWMFVFLALVFAVGFVGFGVGAGGTGIGDILQGGGSSGLPSVSDARKRTEKNPKDAQAWRDLATALQTQGLTDEAITALDSYNLLKPKDTDALRELAGLHLNKAAVKQNEAQLAQVRATFSGASQDLPWSFTLDGRSIFNDPLGSAITERESVVINDAAAAAGLAASNAITVYQKIVKIQPNDPNVRLELASTAQQAGDYAVAVAAYKRFLKLAPDDPNAVIVKQQLKRLQQAASATTSVSSG
jgi:tetratricopeptide (TPR) repeat protein